ncbi:FAD-dependent oxidoreductase [uncultured Algimonas sp.]|uniref:flavin monoamine oxidase family protein n=1 Tax=uncultured Algimonas sp. TaxID=1547920 RepID=UPI00261870A6|nr:FAD-dependent oxidoreductase [uncultured Algimonas sp.]
MAQSTHGAVDCIVVGAGFAGLCAAAKLEAEGFRVKVLEARDRVGGRTESGEIAGLTVDLGGMWVGPTQTALSSLGETLGAKTYPTFLQGRSVGRVKNRRVEVEGESLENEIGLVSKVKLGLLIAKLEKIGSEIDPGSPWESALAERLDRHTVASWADRNIGDRNVRTLVFFIVRSVFCCEPEDLSMLFFLFYLTSAGGLEVLVQAGPGGAQNHLYVGGLHQLAVKLADRLRSEIVFGAEVSAITQSETGVRVETSEADVYSAAAVIMTAPPPLVNLMRFDPPLPAAREELLKRQVMGACIKVWIAYETPFWREQGLNGSLVDDRNDVAPVFDVTPPGASVGLLSAFFDAKAAVDWKDRTPEARRDEVLRTLVAAFGDKAAEPVDFIERNWCEETFSGGCYGAYMPPGAMTKYGASLRRPHGRVFWAGTETSPVWSGYIDGAIRSGEAAAMDVAEFLKH